MGVAYGIDPNGTPKAHKVDTGGALDVNVQDQHTELIDLSLVQLLDTLDLLANYAIDDRSINVETTGYTPLVANSVCLKEQTSFYQGNILAVTPIAGNQYTLDLDTPLDFAFTTAGGCSVVNHNMAVDGSVTPVEFSVSPSLLNVGVEWDIVRVLISFLGPGYGTPPDDQPDDAGFGATAAITNGIVLRSENDITKNIFNAKTNYDLRARAFDVSYQAKNKDGFFGTAFRRTFGGQNKNGVVLRLRSEAIAANSGKVVVIVQDDLTAHEHILGVVQGHVVE